MSVRYAVLLKAGAWRLFRGEAEIAAFPRQELAASSARRVARIISASGFSVELLLQDRFGELRSEHYAGRNDAWRAPAAPGQAEAKTGRVAAQNVH